MAKKKNELYPSPNAGSWVYSHDAVKTSRKSANNHNKACYEHTPVCSPDKKWAADLVSIRFTLDGDPPVPKRRFPKLTKKQVKSRTKIVAGPKTHWTFVGVEYDEALRNVTVHVKGWTRPQKWQVSLPVEEWQD